jgi:hypothetical protein
MRHDWIFDVLADLRVYAEQNDLPALAAQVAATLRVADLEIWAEASAMVGRVDASPHEGGAKPQRGAH